MGEQLSDAIFVNSYKVTIANSDEFQICKQQSNDAWWVNNYQMPSL